MPGRMRLAVRIFLLAGAVMGGLGAGTPLPDEAETVEDVQDSPSGDGDVVFVATCRLDPESTAFPAGKEFDVLLELTGEGETVRAEMGPIPAIEVSDNLTVVGTASGNRTRSAGDRVTEVYFYRYTLKGSSPGEGKVRSAELRYRLEGGDAFRVLRTPELTVSIIPAAVGGPPMWQKILVAGGIPVVALVVIGVALVVRARRKRQAEEAEEIGEAGWVRELEAAQRKRYEGDPRGYLDALAEVLRGGLAEKYGLGKCPGVSVLGERLAECEPKEEIRDRCLAIFDECETARYAREVPPLEDLDRLARRIQDVLEAS